MTSKKNVLSALVAVAMFVLPASALAGHHHDWDDQPRPYAWHDQGRHQGWLKHHGPYTVRPIEDKDDQGEHYHFRPRHRPSAFLCDEDGDDCRPAAASYGDNGAYGPPLSFYRAEPPVGQSLIQQRNWLLQRRQAAYNALYAMRVRHDGRAASRLLTTIQSLDGRIAHDNRVLAGGGYMPSVRYYGTAPNSNYAYNPNSAYGPNYGYNPAFNPSYGASPALNAITSMVGPLFGRP